MEGISNTPMNITPQEQEEFEFRLRFEMENGGSPTMPKPVNRLQETMPQRPSPLDDARSSIVSLQGKDFIPGNVGGMGKQAMTLLQLLGVGIGAGESYVANRAMRAQNQGGVMRGMGEFINPMTAGQDLKQAVTGPRATLGDVNYRAGMGRGTADVVGGAENLMLQAPELLAGGLKLGARGVVGAKNLASKAVQPTKELFQFGIGKKIDALYDSIGKIKGDIYKLKDVTRPGAEADFTAAALKKSEQNKGILNSLGDKITKTYGKAVDDIDSTIPIKATKDDFGALADDTLKELRDEDLLETTVGKKLLRFIDKNKPVDGVIQLEIKPLTINELKNMKNDTVGSFVVGRSEENVAKAIFLKKYGKFMENYTGGALGDLNKEFAPYINEFKRASKIFNSKNQLLQRGAESLKRIAVGDPTKVNYIDDLKTLDVLEKGSGRFGGVGKGTLTGNMKSNVQKIKDIDNEIIQLEKATQNVSGKIEKLKDLRRKRNAILVAIGSALGIGGSVGLGVKLAK